MKGFFYQNIFLLKLTLIMTIDTIANQIRKEKQNKQILHGKPFQEKPRA